MGKAKCKICGTVLDTETAYCITKQTAKTKRNFYYCSEEEYDKDQQRKKKEAKDYYAVADTITEIFGYKVENSTLHKEWKRWNNLADNEKIAEYLQENKGYICGALNKDFNNENAKLKYFSAILCNSLIDFKTKVKEEPKPIIQVEEVVYETKLTDVAVVKSSRRRSLADLEDMF